MKTPIMAIAASLVALSLAGSAKAQYPGYYQHNNMSGYSNYANPYTQSNFTFQNSYGYNPNAYGYNPNAYGYNPNVYGYNPNSYFSPSNGNLYRNYNSMPMYGYRTYTYRYYR